MTTSETWKPGSCLRKLRYIATTAVLILVAQYAVAGTVTGTVKDSVSNAALSGVLVKVNQQSGKQATTNTSGVYSIASVAAGTVTLNASKTAYIGQNSGNVIVPASGTVTAPVILLVKMGTITGKVVNASGGAAVASATVTVTGTSTSTTTNSSGNFTLYQPTGTVTLTIAKTGWVTKVTGNLSVTNNQTTAVGNIPVTKNGTLSGKVVNALGAAAISGATVTANPGGATATTTSTGTFSFSIAPGSYTLTVTKSGWISKTTSAYAVTANTTTATGNIGISQSAITGKVVNSAGGAALSGATVTVTGTSNTATSDASGNFTLSLAPATVTITVTKTGFQSTTTGSLTTVGGQTTNAGNIQIGQASTLSGKVVNALGGAAVSGATVTASPGGSTATTSGTGDFSLSLPAGTYTLAVTKSAWITTNTSSYGVTSGQTTATGNIALSQSAMSGTVVAAAGGAPVPGATVKVTGTSNSTTTDAAGTFRLSLAPATVTLTVTKASWRNLVTGNTTTTGGQTSNVGSLTLVETATVNGYVKDSSSGTGISGATIVLTGDVAVTTTTDGAGSFTLANVPLGNRSLDVSANDYQSLTTSVFAVSSGSNAIADILLSSGFGSIDGTVKDASTDFPLVGALVQLTSNIGIAAETDGLGQFQLTNVPSGTQTLTVSRGWYQALESASFSVAGGSPTAAPALLISPLPSAISGHVYFSGTRDPLESATITLARTGQSVASGADGSFAFSGLAAGYEYVLVSKPGYRQIATGEIYLDPDGMAEFAFELPEIDPSYSAGLIHGFVLDSSGNPLPGATITAIGLPPVISGADGSYSVTAPHGSYVVRAEKSGHVSQLSRWIPGPGYFNSPWQAPISFRLPSVGATGTLTVNTIEPVSRAGGAGEQVLRTLSGLYIVRTPASGSRSLSSFPAGVVFSGWTVPTVIPAGGAASVSLDAWPVLPQVSPHWAAAGQVFRAFSRTPIPNASVTLSNTGSSFSTTLTTDSTGRFSLAGAPLGEYSVTATGPGLPVSDPWTFTATDDSYQGTVGFFLRDPAEEGQVAVTSHLPGVIVTSNEWAVSAQTSNLAPEDYVVNAWADVSGCGVESISPTYGADGRAFNLSFTASCSSGPSTLVVSVVTANGLVVQTSVPVTIANPPRISNLDLGSPTVLGGLILNGSVSLAEQAPVGGAVISLSSDSTAAVVPVTVEVAAGSSWAPFQTVTRPVSASTTIQVTASNAAGSVSQALEVEPAAATSSFMGHLYQPGTQTPIPNAVVTLARTGQSVTTDAAGAYAFEGLLPGWDNLVISGPGLRHSVTNEIFINAGDAFVDLDLGIEPVDATMPDGVLRGTVRDPSGSPLAGVAVTVPGLSDVLSGVDGTYQIAAPAGAYVLRAEKAGYRTQLCRRHQGAGYFRTAWEIWQDFTLPLIADTGTVDVTTIEPVSRGAGPGVVWLRSLFGLYPVETPAAGTRVVTGFPAGRLYDNRGFPLELPAGGALSLSVDGFAVIPGTPPSWAAAGIVRRTASHDPVAGASIVLQNPSQGFSTTVTTDSNGRFSLSGGPDGDYTVTGSAADLPSFGPWGFNAANDGGLRGVAQFDVRDPAEDGTLSITAPPPGAVLASSTWTLSAVASLPIPDDYVVNVWVEIPDCTVGAASTTYQLGGRAVSVSLPVSCLSGARTVTLSAVTRNDAVLTATVPITVQNPAGVQQVNLGATSILGGIPVDGSATLSEPAPAGGKVLSLVSDRPDLAAVPASVLVPQGSSSTAFVVTTFPVAAAAQARITASVGASTASALLQVRPNTVQQLTLGSGSVSGGSNTSGLVRVAEAAPSAGTVVVLASSQPTIASVPATVTVTQGQTTAGFTVATAPVLIESSSIISASIGASSSSQTIVVRASAPLGEMSEGNAASWAAVATDAAAATLSDDSSRAAIGSSSLRLASSSAAETGWAFPGSGSLHWDLSARTFLSFWLYVPSGGPALATGQPVVVLTCASGSYRYEPPSALITTDAWRRYDVPIVPAESQWIRTPSGTPSLTDVLKIEIRLRPQSPGLTAWLDGVVLASALAGDLAEGNATDWGTFASDAASASVVDSALNVFAGASSLGFTTASGFDSGLTYPADALGHWNLSETDSLSFWIRPTNNNYPGFQGNQPVIVLRTATGSYSYEPSGTLLTHGTTRLYQVPLAGGGPWTRTATGAPDLSFSNQLEFHFDTWGYGYSLSVDGLGFGGGLPTLRLEQKSVAGGSTVHATATVPDPAPVGGLELSLASSDNGLAAVPASVTITSGERTAEFDVTTSAVASDATVTISFSQGQTLAAAALQISPTPGVINGTVVHQTTGLPVSGAEITTDPAVDVAITNASGAFSLSRFAGSYVIVATKAGLAPMVEPSVQLGPGQVANAGPIYMVPAGQLTGSVTSSTTGLPVNGATVEAVGAYGRTTSSASGGFNLSVSPGDYPVRVTKAGFVPYVSSAFHVVEGEATSAGAMSIVPTATLTGRIVDAVTLSPLAGASVVCDTTPPRSIATNASGQFSIPSLSPGGYRLTVTASGHVSYLTATILVAAGETKNAGDLRVMPGSGEQLDGSITSSTTWTPAGGPYFIRNVEVASGATLRIEAGTQIYFFSSGKLTLSGNLIVEGSHESRVVFAIAPSGAGGMQWSGITFASGPADGPSRISFTDISGANTAVTVSNSEVAIDHVQFTNVTVALRALTGSAPRLPRMVQSTVPASATGVDNQTDTFLDCYYNYWGAADGPKGGAGHGAWVSLSNFEPWLAGPPASTRETTSSLIRNRVLGPHLGISFHFRPNALPQGTWTLRAVDRATGAVLRSVSTDGTDPELIWDGKDEAGVPCPPLGGSNGYQYEVGYTGLDGISATPVRGNLSIQNWSWLFDTFRTSGAMSPNGDGLYDTGTFSVTAFPYPDSSWILTLKTAGGRVLKTLSGVGRLWQVWDGYDAEGLVAPDGVITAELHVSNDSASLSATTSIILDTVAPVASFSSPTPDYVLSNWWTGQSVLEIAGTYTEQNTEFAVVRYWANARPEWVLGWNDLTSPISVPLDTTAFDPGDYTVLLWVRDKAWNETKVLRTFKVKNFSMSQSVQEANVGIGQSITYTGRIPKQCRYRVDIKNEAGAIVRTLVDEVRDEGVVEDTWNGNDDAGRPVPDGAYFVIGTVSDALSSFVWDQTSVLVDDDHGFYDPYGLPTPDFFNNKPLSYTYSFGDPSRVSVFFAVSCGHPFGDCRPPNFCMGSRMYVSSGPHTVTWAGVDGDGVARPDICGVGVNRDSSVPRNAVVLFGRTPSVTYVRVTPPFYSPVVGGQEISFNLSTYQSHVADVTITVLNQTSRSLIKTISLPAQAPGLVTVSWDGKADGNGLWAMPGLYTVTVRAVDEIGNVAQGQIQTTIGY